MNRMWNTILEPIIHELDLEYIVEIGSDKGINTKNILEYCLKYDKHMIAIDPHPKFDLKKYEKKYGKKFKIYQDISLTILPKLKEYDCVLIDGDHNWYTVFNELKIIDETFNEDNFPLIFLHDISWPYGRRDLYYNPDSIPKKYLNQYEKKAIKLETDELNEIGLNGHLFNAINVNNEKNGVLTAIEDFMKECPINLEFIKIPTFHGLGILFKSNEETNKIIKSVITSSNIMSTVEKFYLDKIINLTQDISSTKKNNDYLDEINNKNIKELKKQETIITHLQNKSNTHQQINDEQELHINNIKKINNPLSELNDKYIEKTVTKNQEKKNLKKDNELFTLNNQLKDEKINKLQDRIFDLNNISLIKDNKINSLETDYEKLEKINEDYSNKILKLEKEYEEILNKYTAQNQKITNLTNENQILVKNNKQIFKDNLTKEKSIKKITEKNKFLKEENNSLKDKINYDTDLEQLNDDLKKKNNILKSNNENLIKDNISKDEKILSLQEKNEKIDAINQKLKSIENNETYLKQLTHENEIINQKNINLTQRNSILTKDKQQLLKKNAKYKSEKEKLLLRNSQLTQTKSKMVKNISNLKTENKNYIANNSKLKEITQKQQKQIGYTNLELKIKIREINILNETCLKLKNQIEKLKETNEVLTKNKLKIQEDFQKLTLENEEYLRNNMKLNNIDKNHREKLDLIKEDLIYLKNQISTLEYEKKSLSNIIDTQKDLIEDYENSNSWKLTKPLRKIKNLFKK